MLSYFVDEDLAILDFDGLASFVEEYCKAYEKTEKEWCNEFIKPMIKNTNGKRTFSFDCWHDIKLISYWYDVELLFLRGVAPYLSGTVEWDFESKDEAGSVEFKDGNCEITTGAMDWKTWKPDELLGHDGKKIPKIFKKLLLAGKL